MSADEEVESVPLIGREEHIAQFRPKSVVSPAAARLDRYSVIILIGAVLVSLTSFLINGYALSFSFRTSRVDQPSLKINDLRRPSLYQGLERVPDVKVQLQIEQLQAQLSEKPEHDQLLGTENGPSMSGMPSAQNDWVLPDRIARVNSRYPTMHYPQDNWVLLTQIDRILMEFTIHAPAEGAQCSLTTIFPERGQLQEKLLTIESDDPEVASPSIRITLVPEDDMLDISKVSWNTRPVVQTVLGTLQASFGSNDTTPSFKCPSAHRLQVELECLSPGCRVEYKSEISRPKLGLGLVQVGS